MTAISELESDLDWREAELSVLRLLLSDRHISKIEKKVLFRAAWALLYAHYEGFCKFALSVYFDQIKSSNQLRANLPLEVQCFSLEKDLKQLRTLPAKDLLNTVLSFHDNYMCHPADFPDVDTRSNLHPDTLQELLTKANLSIECFDACKQRLATLVRRRNKIAHGERDMIEELEYYLSFEDAFKCIAYELAYAIDAKLNDMADAA